MSLARKIVSPLFHATIHDFDYPRVGPDSVFWTCESSAIAQTYLPISVGTLQTQHVFSSQHNEPVAPNRADPYYAIVLQMGFHATEIQYNLHGVATKWAMPKGYPSYGSVIDFIENTLGYQSAHPVAKSYLLKCEGWDPINHQDTISPANFQSTGFLWIIASHEKLKLFDLALAQHHLGSNPNINLFDQIADHGYDGVILPDHCQSLIRGTVSHRSIGFFEKTLPLLTLNTIPATHFEWSENNEACLISPEHQTWIDARAAVEKNANIKTTLDVHEPIVALRRIRDERDCVPKGTRGVVLRIEDDRILVEFSGDILMDCAIDDICSNRKQEHRKNSDADSSQDIKNSVLARKIRALSPSP